MLKLSCAYRGKMAISRYRFCLLFITACVTSCKCATLPFTEEITTGVPPTEPNLKKSDDGLKSDVTNRPDFTMWTNGKTGILAPNEEESYRSQKPPLDVKYKSNDKDSVNPIFRASNSPDPSTTPKATGTGNQGQTMNMELDITTILPSMRHQTIKSDVKTATENKEKDESTPGDAVINRSKEVSEKKEKDENTHGDTLINRSKEVSEKKEMDENTHGDTVINRSKEVSEKKEKDENTHGDTAANRSKEVSEKKEKEENTHGDTVVNRSKEVSEIKDVPHPLLIHRSKEIAGESQTQNTQSELATPGTAIPESKEVETKAAKRGQSTLFTPSMVLLRKAGANVKDHKSKDIISNLTNPDATSENNDKQKGRIHDTLAFDVTTYESKYHIETKDDGQISEAISKRSVNPDVMLRSAFNSHTSDCQNNCQTTISPTEDEALFSSDKSSGKPGGTEMTYKHKNDKFHLNEMLARISIDTNITTVGNLKIKTHLIGSIIRNGSEGGILIDRMLVESDEDNGKDNASKSNKPKHHEIKVNDKFIKMFEYSDTTIKNNLPIILASSFMDMTMAEGRSFLKPENH